MYRVQRDEWPIFGVLFTRNKVPKTYNEINGTNASSMSNR